MAVSLISLVAVVAASLFLLAASRAAYRAGKISSSTLATWAEKNHLEAARRLLRDWSIAAVGSAATFFVASGWLIATALLASTYTGTDQFLNVYTFLALGLTFIQGWRSYKRKALALEAYVAKRGPGIP